MKILLDMNLSPGWVAFLARHGHDARHWSQVGARTADDQQLLQQARTTGATLITRDLDFGALLAFSGDTTPSVVLLRAGDLDVETLGPLLIDCLHRFSMQLAQGALIVLDEERSKLRLLPIRREP